MKSNLTDHRRWLMHKRRRVAIQASKGGVQPAPGGEITAVPFLVVDFANDVRTFDGAPITMAEMHGGQPLSPAIAARTVPGVGLKSIVTTADYSQNGVTVRFNDAILAIFEQGFVMVMDYEQQFTGEPYNPETDYVTLELYCYAGPDVDGYYAIGVQNGEAFTISAFPVNDYETEDEFYSTVGLGAHKLAIRRSPGLSHDGSHDGVPFALGPLGNDAILPQEWFWHLGANTDTPGADTLQIVRSISFYPPEAFAEIAALTA